jgi:hypothetical protein
MVIRDMPSSWEGPTASEWMLKPRRASSELEQHKEPDHLGLGHADHLRGIQRGERHDSQQPRQKHRQRHEKNRQRAVFGQVFFHLHKLPPSQGNGILAVLKPARFCTLTQQQQRRQAREKEKRSRHQKRPRHPPLAALDDDQRQHQTEQPAEIPEAPPVT